MAQETLFIVQSFRAGRGTSSPRRSGRGMQIRANGVPNRRAPCADTGGRGRLVADGDAELGDFDEEPSFFSIRPRPAWTGRIIAPASSRM